MNGWHQWNQGRHETQHPLRQNYVHCKTIRLSKLKCAIRLPYAISICDIGAGLARLSYKSHKMGWTLLSRHVQNHLNIFDILDERERSHPLKRYPENDDSELDKVRCAVTGCHSHRIFTWHWGVVSNILYLHYLFNTLVQRSALSPSSPLYASR